MANQQLIDYVKEQRDGGVNDSAIKETLMRAGWAESDVNEAFSGVVVTAPFSPPSSSSPATVANGVAGNIGSISAHSDSGPVIEPNAGVASKPDLQNKAQYAVPASVFSAEKNQKPTNTTQETPASTPSAEATSVDSATVRPPNKPTKSQEREDSLKEDLLPNEGFFEKQSPSSPSVVFSTNSSTPSVAPEPKSKSKTTESDGSDNDKKVKGKNLLTIILLTLCVLLAGAVVGVYSLMSNRVPVAPPDTSSVSSQRISSLESQVNDLEGDNETLTSEIESLNASIEALLNELSLIVVVPQIISQLPSGEDHFIGFKATLASSTKGYLLTTENGVQVLVENSSEKSVQAVLKPLVGESVDVEGTHEVGVAKLKLISINGTQIED